MSFALISSSKQSKQAPVAEAHRRPPVRTRRAGRGFVQRKCACSSHGAGACSECSSNRRLGMQTKLKVNELGDVYEREADRIADQVMTSPTNSSFTNAPPTIQRLAADPGGQMDAVSS